MPATSPSPSRPASSPPASPLATLRGRLMAAFLSLGLLPLTVAGTFLAWNAYHDDLQEAWAYQSELSRRIGLEVEGYFHGVERELAGLDRYRAFLSLDADEQRRLLSELLHTAVGFREVALVDRGGIERRRLSRTHIVDPETLRSRGNEEAVRCALAGRSPCYGDIRIAADTGEPQLTLAHALTDPRSGHTTGVLTATISMKPVWNLISALRLPSDECAYLLDDDGRVVAHHDPSVVLRGTRHFAPSIGEMPPEWYREPHTGLRGEEVIAATRVVRLGTRQFRVVAERELEAARRPALIGLAIVVGVLALAMFAVLLLTWLANRNIIQPIQRVTDAAREIQAGDLERRVGLERDDELGQMASAFDGMTAKLRGSLEALEHERSLLRSLIDSIPDLIFIKDRKLRFSNCNRAFEKRVGRPAEELIGKDVFQLFPPEEAESYYRSDRELLRNGERVQVEESTPGEDGWPITYDTIKLPFYDADGTPRGLIGVARDITERKRIEEELARHRDHLEELVEERTRELEVAQEELLRKERLATLGQLTATVSHELRNPLGAMRPSLYLIRKRVGEGEEPIHPSLEGALERIERSITRCDHIIDELLDFTRIRALERIPTLIDPWLTALLDEQAIPEGVTLALELGLPRREAAIDPNRLRRAVINVVENACHALQEERVAEVGPAEGGGPRRLTITTGEHDGRIEIAVRDNGPGIPPAVLARVFEPLYSTKGFGVGLGLPTVKQIMEQHGGDIEIDTRPGFGTTMVLWLPGDEAAPLEELPGGSSDVV